MPLGSAARSLTASVGAARELAAAISVTRVQLYSGGPLCRGSRAACHGLELAPPGVHVLFMCRLAG
jgi:hypothetical protein